MVGAGRGAWAVIIVVLAAGCATPAAPDGPHSGSGPAAGDSPGPIAQPEPTQWTRTANATRFLPLGPTPAYEEWIPASCDPSGARQRNRLAPTPSGLEGGNGTVAQNIAWLLDDEVVRAGDLGPEASTFATRRGAVTFHAGAITYSAHTTVFGTDAESLRLDLEWFLRALGVSDAFVWDANGAALAFEAPGWMDAPAQVVLTQSARDPGTLLQLVHVRNHGDVSEAIPAAAAMDLAQRHAVCQYALDGSPSTAGIVAHGDSAAYPVLVAGAPDACGQSPTATVHVDAMTGAILASQRPQPTQEPSSGACP